MALTTVPRNVDPAAVRTAKERLDAHVREIVRWHFDPATGCPFWLERARAFDFDPMKDINTYADLDRFGAFEHLYARRSFQQSADAVLAAADA